MGALAYGRVQGRECALPVPKARIDDGDGVARGVMPATGEGGEFIQNAMGVAGAAAPSTVTESAAPAEPVPSRAASAAAKTASAVAIESLCRRA